MIYRSRKAAGFAQSSALPSLMLFSIVQLKVWG